MKKNTISIILICFILSSSFIIFEFRLDNIVKKFDEFFNKNHTQKIYIHTNKDNFIINETIWFAAYVVAADNKPDTLSENLFVELISPESKIIYTHLLKLENGLANADFPVPDSLQNGIYQIRAFTEWMKNYDSDFFFTKEISIDNATNNKISKDLFLKTKKTKRKSDNFSITFFPEGGELVYGIESKIAFKSVNYLGEGIEVNGVVKNNKNKTIIEFKSDHNGMGTFLFTPEENQKYLAEFYYKNKKNKVDFAKDILIYGYVLNINQSNEDSIKISVKANLFENNDKYNKTIYFIAQQDDEIKYKTSRVLENLQSEFYIPRDSFKTGIVQLTLFNGKAEPRCERLIFINNNDFPKIEFQNSKSENNINIKFNILDESNLSLKAYFSVSVLDTSENISSDNIISTFLLSSDLAGNIENPNYYFVDNWNKTKEQQLDLVMLTNGWRRFKWGKIMSEVQDSLKFDYGRGITVEGRISKVFLDLPSKQTSLTMTMLDSYNDVFTTLTDEEGKFVFKNLYYPDTLNILLEAITKKEKDNVLINTNEYDTIPILFFPFSEGNIQFVIRKNIIKEEKVIRSETNSGLHGSPDQVIYTDKLSSSKSSVFELIQSKSPGVIANDNGVNIRNNSSFNSSTEPLYLIDDMPVDVNAVKTLSVSDVERIEIIKSMAKSAIYGGRGQNGVIAIYTKQGYNIVTGWQMLKLIAYYTPKEYYQSDFEKTNQDSIISSIYWNPDIKTDISGISEINFKIPAYNSNFRLILQGITENGNLIYLNEVIEF
jgi:hypothetical protein